MNRTEALDSLHLRASGELDPAEGARLDEAMAREPALCEEAEALQRLCEAARASTSLTTPDTPPLFRERLLREAARRRRSAPLPRILALAAGWMLALGLWTHLGPSGKNDTLEPRVVQDGPVGVEEGAVGLPLEHAWADLEALREELEELAMHDVGTDLWHGDAESWAEELLFSFEDAI